MPRKTGICFKFLLFFFFCLNTNYLETFILLKDQSDIMENEIILNSEEVIHYVKNEVKQYDILEISYNRIYVPAEVIDVEHIIDENDTESLNLVLQLKGELLNDTVQLDLVEIKDDIIEIRHLKNEEVIVIVVEDT